MANFEEISEKIKKGTDFITGKNNILTNLFSSVKKAVPAESGYSVSRPVKTSDGAVEIKVGEKSVKSSGSFVEKIMNRKVLVPALVIIGIYFGFRKLTKT